MKYFDGKFSTGRVQELKGPKEGANLLLRAFGGSMLQLRDEAWALLDPVCSLKHMGAAEYEFGALPSCLSSMVHRRETFATFELELKPEKDFKLGFWRDTIVQRERQREIKTAKADGKKPPRLNRVNIIKRLGMEVPKPIQLFLYAPAGFNAPIQTLIREIALGTMYVKNSQMSHHFDPDPRYPSDTIGWLDIDNGILWTTDASLRDRFKTMMDGISLTESVAEAT